MKLLQKSAIYLLLLVFGLQGTAPAAEAFFTPTRSVLASSQQNLFASQAIVSRLLPFYGDAARIPKSWTFKAAAALLALHTIAGIGHAQSTEPPNPTTPAVQTQSAQAEIVSASAPLDLKEKQLKSLNSEFKKLSIKAREGKSVTKQKVSEWLNANIASLKPGFVLKTQLSEQVTYDEMVKAWDEVNKIVFIPSGNYAYFSYLAKDLDNVGVIDKTFMTSTPQGRQVPAHSIIPFNGTLVNSFNRLDGIFANLTEMKADMDTIPKQWAKGWFSSHSRPADRPVDAQVYGPLVPSVLVPKMLNAKAMSRYVRFIEVGSAIDEQHAEAVIMSPLLQEEGYHVDYDNRIADAAGGQSPYSMTPVQLYDVIRSVIYSARFQIIDRESFASKSDEEQWHIYGIMREIPAQAWVVATTEHATEAFLGYANFVDPLHVDTAFHNFRIMGKALALNSTLNKDLPISERDLALASNVVDVVRTDLTAGPAELKQVQSNIKAVDEKLHKGAQFFIASSLRPLPVLNNTDSNSPVATVPAPAPAPAAPAIQPSAPSGGGEAAITLPSKAQKMVSRGFSATFLPILSVFSGERKRRRYLRRAYYAIGSAS